MFLQRINKKKVSFFLLTLFLKIIVSLIFSFIASNHDISNKGFDNFSKLELFILVSLIAPLTETFFFQLVINHILETLKIHNLFLKIFLMSIAFSSFHQYNYLYIMASFLGGILLNNFYLRISQEKNTAFISTFALHSLYNIVLFTLSFFL